MTQRSEQLASAIDRALREVFSRGFQDPRIGGLITITNVKVTQDGREAFVGISVLPAERTTLTLHGLQAASTYIRREVGDLVRVRVMPLLTFREDDSIKKQAKVLQALDKVRDEIAKQSQPPAGDSPADTNANTATDDHVNPGDNTARSQP